MQVNKIKQKRATALLVILLIIGLDQLTKAAVLSYFSSASMPLVVTSFFNLVLVWNQGISFGLLNQTSSLGLWVLPLLASGITFYLLYWLWTASSYFSMIALAIVVGGAIGNIIDRLWFGKVIDFLDFHLSSWHWPAFNLADTAICIGVFLLIAENFVRHSKKKEKV